MQCLENNGEHKTENNAKGEARKRAEDRGLEKEEEDYFNEDRWVSFFVLQKFCVTLLDCCWSPCQISFL
jgi:hypothetical protein